MCVCVSECLHVRRSLCLSVCVYVCMYVCAYRYTDVGMQSGTHLSATMALTLIHFRSTIYHLLQRCLLSRKVVVKLLGARGAWPGRTNVRLVRSLAIHLQKDIFFAKMRIFVTGTTNECRYPWKSFITASVANDGSRWRRNPFKIAAKIASFCIKLHENFRMLLKPALNL